MCLCRRCWKSSPSTRTRSTELRARAKDALLTMEIAREESVEEVSQDLRDLEGMTPDLVAKLADGGVHTPRRTGRSGHRRTHPT